MAFGILDILSGLQGGFSAVATDGYTPITYPLSLPSFPGFTRVSIRADVSTAVAMSAFTYQTQLQRHAGERWVASISLPRMTRENAEEWISFLLMLNGPYGTFLLGDPQGETPRGTVVGTPKVLGSGQVGHILVTDGWASGSFGVLRAGDWIQIGQRMYKVLRDVDSNSDGQATLDIWPRLRESPGNAELIITSSCKGIFRLASPQYELWDVGIDGLYTLTLSAVEAV